MQCILHNVLLGCMLDKEFVTLLENYDGSHFFETAARTSTSSQGGGGGRGRSAAIANVPPNHKLSISGGPPSGFPGGYSIPADNSRATGLSAIAQAVNSRTSAVAASAPAANSRNSGLSAIAQAVNSRNSGLPAPTVNSRSSGLPVSAQMTAQRIKKVSNA